MSEGTQKEESFLNLQNEIFWTLRSAQTTRVETKQFLASIRSAVAEDKKADKQLAQNLKAKQRRRRYRHHKVVLSET